MAKKKNLLVVSSRFPFPLEKGDKLRMYNQIKDLSTHFNLYLFSISEYAVSKTDQEELLQYLEGLYIHQISVWNKIVQLGVGLLTSKKPLQVHYFYNKQGQKHLDRLVEDWKIDMIYCQLIRMSEYVNHYPHYKVLDYMDSFALGLQRRMEKANLLQKPVLGLEKDRVISYQADQADLFNMRFIIAENDRKSIQTQLPIELLRNGVDFDFFVPKAEPKKYDLVFVGNMQYHPNVLAACFLVNEILPLCNKEGLKLNVLIAGANPTKEVKLLASEHVEVSGWIDDIRDAYRTSKIFVAPLFTGSGLQNKVLEAMACKIPVITTPIVNHSLEAESGYSISIAEHKEAFMQEIKELLQVWSKEELEDRVDNAYRFVHQKYGWTENNQVLINAFKK